MAKLSEKARKNKVDYNIKYSKQVVKRVVLNLNQNTMADVIEWLDTKDNKQGYVIDLIRKDILANQKWRNEVINIMKTYYKVSTYYYSDQTERSLRFEDLKVALNYFCVTVSSNLQSQSSLRFELIEYNWDKPCPCILKKVELYNNKEGRC